MTEVRAAAEVFPELAAGMRGLDGAAIMVNGLIELGSDL